jgi:predicted nucleotidyltransferase
MSISKLNLPVNIAGYGFWQKLAGLPFVKAVYLFGSRARGDARPKSDIDLAVNCPEASLQQWQEVLDIVEDADTLLAIDVIRYDHLGDSVFRHKIDQSKVVVYENRNA